MKLIGLCKGCGHKKWFLRKRKFTAKVAGEITSKNQLCNGCVKRINKLLA